MNPFLDPAKILEGKEQKPCGDCIHRLWMWGVYHRICTKHQGRVGYECHKCEDYVKVKP